MRQFPWLLLVLWCTAARAMAGPNAGGVLWVHDTGLVFSTDTPLPPGGPIPADCSGVDNEQDLQAVKTIWKVYAAFPPGSTPRLKGVGWGLSISAAGGGYVAVDAAGCGLPDADGPGTDFAITQNGWPTTDGAMIGQSFPTGPRTTAVVELYYFSGYGYGGVDAAPQSFGAVPHAGPANRFFLDDATPQNADPIMGYGSLGFGQAGTTPCPTNDPDAACCAPLGSCTVTTQGNCAAPSIWHPEWLACAPDPCPLPTGACCHSDGQCTAALEAECPKDGGIYLGDFTACAPNPCLVPGACCAPTGTCAVVTPGSCAAPDAWHPDWPACDPNPCPQPSAGSILAWGDNASGQCNVPPPNTGFTAVAAGSWHSIGLKADGTVTAWGDNGSGQCDVPAPGTVFTAIAAGGRHSLALRADGAVVAWGDDTYGQCDVPAPNAGFVAIAGGDSHSLGLKDDGSVVAWGRNDFGQCSVPAPNTGFAAVAGGWGHSVGLRAGGAIVAWGNNESGQCAVPLPNDGFAGVAAGYLHSLGLRANGAVVAWGYDDFGQCIVPAPNTGFIAVAAGTIHSLALRAGGDVVAWGSNELGQGTTPSPHAAFATIAAGGYHSLGLLGSPGGACCHESGACTLTSQPQCEPPSSWLGAGTACVPNTCSPTPVLLESWTASSPTEGLRIRWELPLATTGALFRTWRDPLAGPYDHTPTAEAVLVEPDWIASSAEGIVVTLDPDAPRGALVRYFLETSIPSGGFIGPVETRWDPPAPAWSAAPTPFRDTVRLAPPGSGPARADIFDPTGRLVRVLERSDGNAPLSWDGRDASHREAPAGVYLVRLTSPAGDALQKLLKTR